MGDWLLSIAAMAGMVIWSLLVRDGRTSLAGFGVALWFPISIGLYRVLLRWLPMIGGVYACPVRATSQQQREITAGCLLTAAFSMLCLACMPAPIAAANILALNFACLAALFDRIAGWLPNHVLIPMLLAGLLAGALRGGANAAILGAAASWGAAVLALLFLSVSLRANLLSGEDVAMAAACGAWVGIGDLSIFLSMTGFLYWASCVAVRHVRAPGWGRLDGPERIRMQPTGPSFALGLAITLLLHGVPGLPNWVYRIAAH